MEKHRPIRGFGNHLESEATSGALPQGQNSPQQVPHNLYAEQLSGSAFTRPRRENIRSWLYRIKPSVVHNSFTLYNENPVVELTKPASPQQHRYSPLPDSNGDFIDSLVVIAGHQDANVFFYSLSQGMDNRFLCNADGDFLFVPQAGNIYLETEFGQLTISPGVIAVIPRGIKFQVNGNNARGYLLENLSHLPFELPNLGPIGANGLANPHDFIYPHAHYTQQLGDFEVIHKYENHLWQCKQNHHPLDVVAWRGNYAPYAYDLSRFNTINTVSFDHPDPSIFTVLTVPSGTPGIASIDFVIFPERWMVAEHTFRPPYYHRNIMSEFMGLVTGQYDAKEQGFTPGGFSIHNRMSAHGPDSDTYQRAIEHSGDNQRYKDTLAFMFETRLAWQLSQSIHNHPSQQADYLSCWKGLKDNFTIKT